MYIEKVRQVSDELFAAMQRLVQELGTHKAMITREELISLVNSEASTLWISKYPDQAGVIVGILTIAIYRIPTGLRSIVEDVVVDPHYRRLGIARALLQSAINFAREAGTNGVALTSNPKRQEANLLYQSMGFERRETNSYFYKL
jgi:ribosomal protein S18 acetylase RimI-like enzyme